MKTCRARGASSPEDTSTFHGAAALRTPTPFSQPLQDQTHFFSTLLASSSRPPPSPNSFSLEPLEMILSAAWKLEPCRVSIARRTKKVTLFESVGGWGHNGKGGTVSLSSAHFGFSLASSQRMSCNNTLEAAFVKLLSRRKGLLSYFFFSLSRAAIISKRMSVSGFYPPV